MSADTDLYDLAMAVWNAARLMELGGQSYYSVPVPPMKALGAALDVGPPPPSDEPDPSSEALAKMEC